MTIQLSADQEQLVRTLVQGGRFSSEGQVIDAALILLEQRERETAPQRSASTAEATTPKPIWKVFEEIARSVPAETWDAVPSDLSEQHDHYIYGTPKRPA
jgi:Arc/MetJ-type ribon-helix-helix transcriptional regulator